MRRILYSVLCLLMLACSGGGGDESPRTPDPDPDTQPNPDPQPDASNTPPGIPMLVFPEKDQLCLDAELNFEWADATDADGDALTYRVQIALNRAFTEIVEDRTVSGTNIPLVMRRGEDFYWRVQAVDAKGLAGEYTASWAFYVEGEPTTNHLPYIPALLAPEQGVELAPGTVLLEWEATDLDGDSLSFDLFFGTSESPELYQANLSQNSVELNVEANTTYYWQIHVSDGQAKSIGEVWTFSTTN